MESTITQSTPGYSDHTDTEQAGTLDRKRQYTNKRQTTKTETQRLHWVPQRANGKNKNKHKREIHWVPQDFSSVKQGSKLVCSASTTNAKLNKQERVNLKDRNQEKPPFPDTLINKNQVDGHFVLFLQQYYPSPFILDPLKLTQAKHPSWMFAPTS